MTQTYTHSSYSSTSVLRSNLHHCLFGIKSGDANRAVEISTGDKQMLWPLVLVCLVNQYQKLMFHVRWIKCYNMPSYIKLCSTQCKKHFHVNLMGESQTMKDLCGPDAVAFLTKANTPNTIFFHLDYKKCFTNEKLSSLKCILNSRHEAQPHRYGRVTTTTHTVALGWDDGRAKGDNRRCFIGRML